MLTINSLTYKIIWITLNVQQDIHQGGQRTSYIGYILMLDPVSKGNIVGMIRQMTTAF